jgi:DNA (cytosine-5)-methyltransferase 1
MYPIASVFSGAGGLDLGFVLTGHFKPVFSVEILHQPAETYSRNFGLPMRPADVPWDGPAVLKGNVEHIDFEGMKNTTVDVLTAGPPCQDFSVVRGPEWDRRGIQVKRGRLYLQFIRALSALRPSLFVFENVPGLVSANKGIALRTILSDFAEAEWTVVFAGIVDSAGLGLPQRRRRLIVIGVHSDLLGHLGPTNPHQLFKRRLTANQSLLAKYPLTPLEAFEGKVLPDLSGRYREIMREYQDLLGRAEWNAVDDYLQVNGIDAPDSGELDRAFRKHGQVLREMGWFGRSVESLRLPDGTAEHLRESRAVRERMKHIPPDENHEYVRGTPWEVEGRGISLIYRRLHPLKPAYTVVAYGGGGTWGYHYERERSKLTQRERARLQGFPDSFLFFGTTQGIRAQIGEAVPPLVAKRIAELCAEVLANAKGHDI